MPHYKSQSKFNSTINKSAIKLNKDAKEQILQTKGLKDQLNQEAKNHFGITQDCMRAGYILENGQFLDFGNPENKESKRLYDHMTISEILKPIIPSEKWRSSDILEGRRVSQAVVFFKKNANAIRFSCDDTNLLIDISTPITRDQWSTIENCACHRPSLKTISFEWWNPIKGKQLETFDIEVKGDCVGAYKELRRKIIQTARQYGIALAIMEQDGESKNGKTYIQGNVRGIRKPLGYTYIFSFKCPNCGQKWNFFFYEDGVHADFGFHKCKKCKEQFDFNCDWSKVDWEKLKDRGEK